MCGNHHCCISTQEQTWCRWDTAAAVLSEDLLLGDGAPPPSPSFTHATAAIKTPTRRSMNERRFNWFSSSHMIFYEGYSGQSPPSLPISLCLLLFGGWEGHYKLMLMSALLVGGCRSVTKTRIWQNFCVCYESGDQCSTQINDSLLVWTPQGRKISPTRQRRCVMDGVPDHLKLESPREKKRQKFTQITKFQIEDILSSIVGRMLCVIGNNTSVALD